MASGILAKSPVVYLHLTYFYLSVGIWSRTFPWTLPGTFHLSEISPPGQFLTPDILNCCNDLRLYMEFFHSSLHIYLFTMKIFVKKHEFCDSVLYARKLLTRLRMVTAGHEISMSRECANSLVEI